MRTSLRGPVALGVALVLAACGGGTATTAPTIAAATSGPPSAAPATAGATAGAAAPCEETTDATTVDAAIADFKFDPANVTASVGDVITWTNADSAPHAVGLDDGSCSMQGNIAQGQKKSLAFSQAGTFPFHCTVHPDMKGTITIS